VAVTSTASIGYMPFGAPDDYRLPLGLWFCAMTVTGDSSGGTAILRAQFYPALLASLGSWHNLESLNFSVSGTPAAETPDFRTDGWSLSFEGGGNFNAISYGLPTQATPARVMNFAAAPLPLTLGRRGVQAGSSPTELIITWSTNTNGNLYIAQAAGHYWSSESLQLSGGPQNPGVAMDALPQPPGGRGFYQRLRAGMAQ